LLLQLLFFSGSFRIGCIFTPGHSQVKLILRDIYEGNLHTCSGRNLQPTAVPYGESLWVIPTYYSLTFSPSPLGLPVFVRLCGDSSLLSTIFYS
jgi:hypothetical protein